MLVALRQGWRLLKRHKKAIVFYYLANLLVASLVLVPFVTAFEDSLGQGDYRETQVERLDNDWYQLLRHRAGSLLGTFSPSVTGLGPFARNLDRLLDGRLGDLPAELVGLGVLYLLINSFLTAAALGSAAVDPRGCSMREFLRTGGEFFGRFLRLGLLSLAAVGAVWLVLLGPLQSWTRDLADAAAVDRTAQLWRWAGLAAAGLLLGFVNLVFDYAKAITAASDRSSVLLASLSALFFCITYLVPATGLYVLLSVLGVAWILAAVSLESLIPQASGWGILTAFLLLQLTMVGRLTLRFWFYTAQLRFYVRNEGLYRPEEEEEKEEPVAPASLPVIQE